jgi:threonine/homoserine/homoserine lactone efflux protein
VLLAVIAMAIDVALGAAYIGAGSRLASAMARRQSRTLLDRAVGTIFIVIALGILIELFGR